MPPKIMTITSNKISLLSWILFGWIVFGISAVLCWNLLPNNMTIHISSVQEKLFFALIHVFMASIMLFIGFLAVGSSRWDLETRDPTANPTLSGNSKASIHNRVHSQFLSNTSEQFVMFSVALLACAPFLNSSYLRLITIATILWIVGRIFFWSGYWYTATHGLPTYPRAVGLGLGLICTLSMAGIAAYGICLFYPDFSQLFDTAQHKNSISIVIQPIGILFGTNLFPIVFFSLMVFFMLFFTFFPKFAPPVVPISLLCFFGWSWVFLSGRLSVR